MSDTKDRPVQTYSREAERLGARVAQKKSDPHLVNKLVSAVGAQATEISNFLIEKAGSPSATVPRRLLVRFKRLS